MDKAHIDARITVFDSQKDSLAAWIRGASHEQRTAYPVPGTWSLQQLVIHMLDSDLAATHRMRRIAAEESPLLIAYDETLFAAKLLPELADAQEVCKLFALNRSFTSRWLRTLPAETFDRAGIHNQRGRVTLGQFVDLYIHHVVHHEPFALKKRATLGLKD